MGKVVGLDKAAGMAEDRVLGREVVEMEDKARVKPQLDVSRYPCIHSYPQPLE
jgi:hypothetical protein